MKQDRAGEPKGAAEKVAQASTSPVAPADKPDPSFDKLGALGRAVWRWIVRFLFRWVATALVLLFVSALFTYVLPGEALLKKFQDQLLFSINNLKPIALFDYVGESGASVWRPVQNIFDAFFGAVGGGIDWVVSLFQDLVSPWVSGLLRFALIIVLAPIIIIVALVMAAGAFAVLGLAVLLSPIIVTLAVIRNGNLIEAALVLLIFLPLVWLLARGLTGAAAADLNMRERAGLLWVGTWMALGITTLFYAVVQVAILGAGWALDKLIPLAPTGIAASAIMAFCYECTKKTLEDTVTESVAETLIKPEK